VIVAYRYALYWAPPLAGPLHRLGSQWLGRDAETGAPAAQPLLPPISAARFAEITAEPRGYGFHATLKPPMRLRDGVSPEDFIEAARAILAGVKAFTAPPLKVGRIGGFLALVPAGSAPRPPRPNSRNGRNTPSARRRTRCWTAGAILTSSTNGAST